MAKKYENMENIAKLISGGALTELSKKISSTEKKVAEVLKKLMEIETARVQAKLEEERIAAEKAAASTASTTAGTGPSPPESRGTCPV